VLAAELAAAGQDGRSFSEGLARYAAVRSPRAMRVQRSARTWGEIWHVDGIAKLIRDELLRTRDVADHRHVAWLYGDSALQSSQDATPRDATVKEKESPS
jgi:salicylate hydroxylase